MAVSAVKKEAAKPAEAEASPAPPKKKAFNWKLPVIGVLVLGAVGGGAYWFMNRQQSESAKEVKAEPVKPPVFLPLDAFTVNLKVEEVPQFLQVGLTLKVVDAVAVDQLKLFMPEIRDRILRLLSSQKASVLLTLEGKGALATDIVTSINAIVAPPPAPAGKPGKSAKAKAKAAAEPADEADAKPAEDEEAVDEEDEEPKPKPKKKSKPAGPTPVVSVLFTSFIVQ